MSRAGAYRILAVLAVALASAPASGSATRSPVALTAAPARVVLAGSANTAVRVTNTGAERVVVDATRAGFSLSLRGRPRIVRAAGPRSAAPWLKLQPRQFVLPARTSISLFVSATVPRSAEPGDHDALVLLTTRPRAGARVAVRARLGLVVTVRAPGAVVRRLTLRALRARGRAKHRRLELAVVNGGNVTETLASVRATVWRLRTRRRVATAVAAGRDLRPHTRGIVEFPLRTRARGRVLIRVVVPGVSGRSAIRRTYELRL